MNLETIISILFGVGGVGSVVVKNYLDKQNKKEDLELKALHELKESCLLKWLGLKRGYYCQQKIE
jgi:hypothetical protein